MSSNEIEPGSFRDRDGRVFYRTDGVYRVLSDKALEDWRALRDSKLFAKYVAAGSLVESREVKMDLDALSAREPGRWHAVLKHQRIPVISYPYEWCFSMLRDAAALQLELLAAALEENLIIKDASSYNIQWCGAKPVFIDIPSIERATAGEPWVGYRQFCELFLYPLMLQAYKNVPFHSLLRGRLDGIEPQSANHLFSFFDRFRAGVFTHVYLQAKLQDRYGNQQKDTRSDLKRAGFNAELIKANVRNLRKLVRKLRWQEARSEWGDYTQAHNYSAEDHRQKEQFIDAIAAQCKPQIAWDIGCNTGQFSRIVARHADTVVAMDADHLTIEKLYLSLKSDGPSNILPLVSNLADPAPNQGWRGEERKNLEQRAHPNLVLCLALIHHVVITANIPLREFIRWLSELGGDLIIEFVTKDDSMVQRLLLNKPDKYDDYEKDYFERCLREFFQVDTTQSLSSGNRHLYFARAAS